MSTGKKIFPYNPKLKELARELRKESTLAEVLLWKYLKGRQLKGYDFHRQKPLYYYIVDFFCPELMLIIEIDGISHEGKIVYDKKRQKFLEEKGFIVLRFTELEIRKRTREVVEQLYDWLDNRGF